MKKILQAVFIIIICLSANTVFSQNKRLKVEIENIGLRAPEDWLVKKTEKKMYGFKIVLYNEKNENHVTLNCIKQAMNLEAAIINEASEKSLKPKFEYMLIEKVKDGKAGKYKGKFVEYTNSFLMDYFRGGFYGIEDNGYTYVIDYYSDDTPESRKQVQNILNSLVILKPESRPNFFEVEKEYLTEDVTLDKQEEQVVEEKIEEIENIDNSKPKTEEIKQATQESNENLIAEIKEPEKEKKSFWKRITSVFKKKKE